MKHKAGRKKYDEMFAIVAQVINVWNPYCLIEDGEPADAFGSEVAQIVAKVPSMRSERDATLAVSRVFSIMFEAEYFSEEMCRDVGTALFTSLKRGGFIEDA